MDTTIQEIIINIAALMTNLKEQFDKVDEIDPSNYSEDELKFMNRVDTIYKVSVAIISVIGAISTAIAPPSAAAFSSILLVMAMLHYYDQKNNYELSHAVVNNARSTYHACKNFFHKNKAKKEDNDEAPVYYAKKAVEISKDLVKNKNFGKLSKVATTLFGGKKLSNSSQTTKVRLAR